MLFFVGIDFDATFILYVTMALVAAKDRDRIGKDKEAIYHSFMAHALGLAAEQAGRDVQAPIEVYNAAYRLESIAFRSYYK